MHFRRASLAKSPKDEDLAGLNASPSCASNRDSYLAVPPLALLAATQIAGASLKWSINIIVWAGAASLGYWGYVAGRRAGFTRWRLVGAIVGGLVIGLVILVVQVLLHPGKVFSGGEL
jgi:hypothetical protein